jgi:hypothetical protein
MAVLRVQRADGSEDCILALGAAPPSRVALQVRKLLPDSAYYKPVQLISKTGPSDHSQHPLPSQSTLKGDQNKVSDLLSFRDVRGELTLSL